MVDKGDLVCEELRSALEALGLHPGSISTSSTGPGVGDSRHHAAVAIDGVPMVVEIRAAVRALDAPVLAKQLGRGSLVVSDRIAREAQVVFRDEGVNWLDRRGHLRLTAGSWVIDSDLPGEHVQRSDTKVNPWSALGRDVVVDLLVHPDEIPSPVAIARRVGARSHSRVSEVLGELRRRNLIDSVSGLPLLPELFWELADAWSAEWLMLVRMPDADRDLFRLAGSLGASWHGAPIAVGENWPPELYTHDAVALRNVVRRFGRSIHGGAPTLRVAACPSRYAWTLDGPEGDEYPVAAAIVVALDLAQDVRGREVLGAWEPTGARRVW